jgi:hypothetical protein
VLILFLFLPLFVEAQQDSASRDTLILDKFFHFVGKQIKKTAKKYKLDTAQNHQLAQMTPKQRIKLGIETSYLGTGEQDFFETSFIYPALTFSYYRHNLSLGPKFIWNDIDDLQFDKPGLQFTYQVNPFKEHRFLNFYFQYNWGFSRDKRKYIATEGIGTTQIVTAASRTTTNIENIFGYGIRLNIYKGLYIIQNLGIGIAWYKIYYRYAAREITSGYNTMTERTNLFMAGLGYRFNIKKKTSP